MKFINYKPDSFLLLSGILLGLAAFFSIGTVFVMGLFSAFLFFVRMKYSKKVFYVFLIAIILRVLFSFLHIVLGYNAGIGSDLIGDSVGYSGGGIYTAEVLTGKKYDNLLVGDEGRTLQFFRDLYKGALPKYDAWRTGGYTYYLGFIYALFGYSPETVKLINAFLFIVTAYMIYLYLLRYAGEKAGFLFLIIYLFFPSLFIWSISGLKDQINSFLFVFGVFVLSYLIEIRKPWGIILGGASLFSLPLTIFILGAFLLFKNNRNVFPVVMLCVALIFLTKLGVYIIRPQLSRVFFIMLQLIALSYLLLYFYRFKLFKTGIAILIVLVLVFSSFTGLANRFYKRFTYDSIVFNMGYQTDAATQYQIYPDRYNYDTQMKRLGFRKFNAPTLREFAVMTIKGLAHVLFYPLAWLSKSKTELFASPEGHFMAIAFLGVINGLFICLRRIKNFFWSLTIIIPFFILLILFTYFEGNVGTLFRHRSMMLPFYFALLAIGLGHNPAKLQ